MLTEAERNLILRAFQQGPGALFDEGWDVSQVQSFLGREEVGHELRALELEFKQREGLEARTRYIAKRDLGKAAGGAVAVLAAALAGPEYQRNPDGTIALDDKGRPKVLRAEITRNQQRAAKMILDGIGVNGTLGLMQQRVEVNLNLLMKHHMEGDEEALVIPRDPNAETEEEQAFETLNR